MKTKKINKTDKYMGYNGKHVCRSLVGLALVMMFSIGDALAQCIVGGTDFKTSKTLCNPVLSNDSDGWFNSKVDKLLKEETAGCDYYEVIGNAIQTGMPSNTITTRSTLFTTKGWADLIKQNGYLNTNPGGFTAITANPKLIDPILSEGNGTNMLVNAGTSHDRGYFMAYSVDGLKPGSNVTLTMDVYYLIDEASMKASLAASGKTEISIFGGSVQYRASGSQMPSAGLKWSTSLDANDSPNTTTSTTIAAKSGAQKVTMTGKADANGRVIFYVSRTNPNALPIGIDNIRITGDIQPVITSAKMMPVCPENPVMLYLKHTYPEGTTYSWSVQGGTETSTTQSFSVTPKEANKTYTAKCSVTPPGCSAASASFTIETKECCTMKDASGNDLPMAETNIFYDDFGTFPDNKTYEYRDAKGAVHTVPVDGGLWTDVTRPFSTKFQPGSDIKGDTYSGNGDITSCITNVNPYTPGINGDASGSGRGGMLIFDVDKAFGKGSGLANTVIYEREICGLCKGKEITFSASFGAVNNNPAGVGEMAIVLRKGSATGEDLLKGAGKSGMLYGNEGWRTVEQKFTVPDNSFSCVVLQVVNITDSYSTSQGDFAIDDIVFSVCTPPDVAVDAVLSGHAKDLLDLCVDDILTLEAEISDVAKQFYGSNIGYLFQYAYEDPTVVDDDKITWYDLSSIQSSGEFVIKDPATHPAFEKIQAGDVLNVYFRVVIGDGSYLSNERDEWEHMSALSPCRAISISSIPIVAGLNCAACSHPDEKRTFTSDKGRLSGKTLRLCKEDGEAIVGLKEPIHGIDKDDKDYYNYEVSWYKDEVKASNLLGTKTCSETAQTAPELKVDWSKVEETGTKYIISIHDYYDPAMTSTPCDITDTIIVYADPVPTDKLNDPDPFCEGTLSAEPNKSIAGYKLLWYEDADTLTPMAAAPSVASTLAADSPSTSYYVLVNTTTGCRGDANPYKITVNPIPEETLQAIPEFCQGDETAKLPTSNSYEVKWYNDANASSAAITDLSTLPGKTVPYTYYYTLTDKSKTPNCTSDPEKYDFTVKPTAEVTVTVTPACDVTTVTTQTVPATATVNWTIDGTTTVSDASSITVDNSTYKAGSYEAIASADGYCDSKPDTKTVTFNSTPDPINASISEYLKADGTPDYTLIDAKVASLKSADPNVKVYWSGVIGSTQEDQSSSMTAPTSGYSTTRANPTPDLSSTDDEFFYYWIYQELENSEVTCPSETTIVVVPILGAPAPIVHDTIYCLNSPVVAALSENVKINQAKPDVTYELVWKDGVDETTVPPVNAVGKFTYEVAQRDKANPNNISAYRKITIDVRGVKVPDVSANKLAYCAEEPAQTLTVTKVEDNANNYYATGFEWFLDGAKEATTPTPNTSVSTTTNYHYGVRQTYTIPTSGEICYGDTATFDVKVTFVPQLPTTQVTYLKADANGAGTFDKNVKEQEPSVYTGEETGATINWYASDGATCGTPLSGTPTPTVDPSVQVGKDQTEYYCVSQTVDNCEGKTNIVTVVISDSPNPIVAPVSYCEGETTSPLTAQINDLTNPVSAYQLIWYDENHSKITDGPTGPTPTATMRAGEVLTSTYKYYVTQKLTSTGAESTESEIVVTVYANPVLSIANPPAICETNVDLAPTVTLTNTVAGQIYNKEYFSDAAGTTALPLGSVVSESGTYYVRYSYNANVTSGATCVSSVDPIVVVIDTLNVITPDTVPTCPAMTATLSSTVEKNTASASYAWAGDGETGTTNEKFTTHAFPGNYGDEYPYTLTVTAGTCVETKTIIVKLGEGPLNGSLTLTDPTKTTDAVVVYKDGMTTDPFYYCGGIVTVTPDYEGSGDYKLTSPSGSSVSGTSFPVSGAGQYRLDFTNGCPTKLFFNLVNAEISLTNTTPVLTMCEKDKFTSTVNVTPAGLDYTLVWKKNDEVISGQTSETYTIESTEPANSGNYVVEADRYGCPATTTIGDLKVKPYIKVVENKDPYIVPRGDKQDLAIQFLEPTDGSILSDVKWIDNAYDTVANAVSYTVTDVQKDHKYIIQMHDDDYCDAVTEMNVWVDAVLEMTTSLADVQCYNMKYELRIDTTGTGPFRQENVSHDVTVKRTMNGTTVDMTDQLKLVNNILVLEVTAIEDASYAINFTYGEQKIDSLEKAEVIPAISVTLPATRTICEGEEIDLVVTDVQPAGTTVTWDSDNTIQGTNLGETITVKPKFVAGTGHQSVYSYYLEAYNEACDNKETYTVKVNVDEPLTGEIIGDSPICETKSSSISAASYEASTYVWTTGGSTEVAVSSDIRVTPLETTTYVVDMTRGTCTAQDQFTVVVTSNPKILSMDSVGIRDRQVITDQERGTGVFTYWLDDNKSTSTTSDIIKNLSFGAHVISVIDDNGCTSSFRFSLDPPEVIIPEFFTPNGDGIHDTWIVGKLAEVYPNAIVNIYDRFGKLVAQFLGDDNDGWDGTYNGVALPSTDYWYMIDIAEIEKQYHGHFTLIRR